MKSDLTKHNDRLEKKCDARILPDSRRLMHEVKKPENNDQCLVHMVSGATGDCFNEQFHIAIFNSNFTW